MSNPSQYVLLLKGLPGCGKSSYAKELLKEFPGVYVRINKDDIRAMLHNSKWSKANEKFVVKTRDQLIENVLDAGQSPIIDDTNLHPKHEINIRTLVTEYNKKNNKQIRVEVKLIDTPIEECIKRDLKRFNSVGETVIRDMYDSFLAPPVITLQQNPSLKHIYIFDIDGTVAEKGDRSPYDWEKVDEDKPKENVIQIARILNKSGYYIFFFSGRDEICREKTEKWICMHFNWDPGDFRLEMRKKGDMRKDTIVKKEMFEQHIKDKFYVAAVFDDRDAVVQLWRREIGLTCLQVNYGNF